MRHLNLRYSILVFSLSIFYQKTDAQSPEFDQHFLYGEQSKKIDLNQITQKDKVPNGDYLLDIYLNHRFVTQSKISISNDSKQNLTQHYCVPIKTIKQLDFNAKAIELNNITQDCIDTQLMHSTVQWKLNIQEQRMDISSPQAMLNERPYGYIDPTLWQDSDKSAFLKYYYNYYRADYGQNNKQDSNFLNLNAGFNFETWQFRHSGSSQFSSKTPKDDPTPHYIQYENKLLTVLPQLNSQLTLGDFYTSTKSINSNTSLAIRGIQIESDDQMLPLSLQSYAPIITGYAKTNALIRVMQNRQVILEKTVPAGAFNINDLLSPSNNGTIQVEIHEANGEIQYFDLPVNYFIQSIRPKQHRYQLALGRYRRDNKILDENILNASFDYGLNNFIALNSALLLSDHYQSYTLGTTTNTLIGGFALEGNFIDANLKSTGEHLQSYLIQLRYNFSTQQAKTNLSLNSTYFGNDQYYNFDEIMQNQYAQMNPQFFKQNQRPKTSQFIQLNQNLGDQWGTFSLGYSQIKYWNNQDTQKNFQCSYSNTINKFAYQIGIQQYDNPNHKNETDTRYFATINFPLSFKKSNANVRMNSEYSTKTNDNNSNQVGIFGSLGSAKQFAYHVNYINHKNNELLSNAVSYKSTPILLSSTFTTDFKQQKQYSMLMQGALVAHRYGLTLSSDLNDTFAIIHAKGLTGSQLLNGNNIKIDAWGNAITPYLSPYQYNNILLNAETIPIDIEVDSTQKQIIPKANTSIVVDFKTTKSHKALIKLNNTDNKVPAGAQVIDPDHYKATMVGQGQQIFLSNIQMGTYRIDWNESNSCQFIISKDMIQQSFGKLPFAQLNLPCE